MHTLTTTVRLMSTDAGDAKGTKPSARRLRRIPFRYWVIIVLAALAAIFIAQNTEPHPIHLLWVTVASPAWLVLTVVFVAGMLVGVLLRRRRR
jgi:lipopolysaccharide assembly protein A